MYIASGCTNVKIIRDKINYDYSPIQYKLYEKRLAGSVAINTC